MIAEFKVANFYSLKDEQTLSFVPTTDDTYLDAYTDVVAPGVRLLKIGCIYGSNASGKTNVLHALDFFTHAMIDTDQKKDEGTGVVPFLLDDDSKHASTTFEMTFYLEGLRYKLFLELNSKVIVKETLSVYTSAQPTLIYDRTYNSNTEAAEIKFGSKSGLLKKNREAIEGNTIVNRTVIAAFGISNVEKTRLNQVYEMFSSKVAPAMMPSNSLMYFIKKNLREYKTDKLKQFVLHFLKASDFNISDIKLRNEEIEINPETRDKDAFMARGTVNSEKLVFTHHTKYGNKELSEELESAGTKRYMGLATILFNLLSHSMMLPIDEVETSIHYELLSYFIRVFLVNSKKQSQLLLTTHDINLLDEDFIRRDTIWFTEKNDSGETQLLRLSSLGLHKTLSVYNAYKQEKLVSLPFTESIFIDSDLYNEDPTE